MRSDQNTTSTTELVPEQVSAMRRIKRMSQAKLASSIKRSQAHVSNFERGLVVLTPREEKIIARVLGLTPLTGRRS